MNNIIYSIAFSIPITIMFIGICNGNNKALHSGFSLLFSFTVLFYRQLYKSV
jgi:hypothetical protein